MSYYSNLANLEGENNGSNYLDNNSSNKKLTSIIDDVYSFLYSPNDKKDTSFSDYKIQPNYNNNTSNDSFYYDYKLSSANLQTSNNELSANQSFKKFPENSSYSKTLDSSKNFEKNVSKLEPVQPNPEPSKFNKIKNQEPVKKESVVSKKEEPIRQVVNEPRELPRPIEQKKQLQKTPTYWNSQPYSYGYNYGYSQFYDYNHYNNYQTYQPTQYYNQTYAPQQQYQQTYPYAGYQNYYGIQQPYSNYQYPYYSPSFQYGGF